MKPIVEKTLVGLSGLALLGLGYLWWRSPGTTAPIAGEHSVAELTDIELNGVRQWLLLRGHDRRKPVLLFLHGGPGLPELPLLTGHPLERHYVVVNWEQRGAGKSYGANVVNEPLTLNQLVDDTVQLSRQLMERFGTGPVVLLGHSFGTLLAVLAAQRAPALYRAVCCVGQMTRQAEAERIAYDWTLQQARRRGNRAAARRLERHGPPVGLTGEGWLAYLTWQRELVARYGGGMHQAHFFPLFIGSILRCREYTLADKVRYALGAQESVRQLWPAVIALDLHQAVPRLAVPYYVFQGVHDYQTPYALASAYAEHVVAPNKQFFTFANSAHSPLFEEPARFNQLLIHVLSD